MIYWKPSLLVVVVSLIVWVGLTTLFVSRSTGHRSTVFGPTSAWSPDGQHYWFYISVEGWGYGSGASFRLLRRTCEVACRRVDMPSHEQGPDLLTAIEFKGDRQMVLDDNGKTFVATIEWGYPGAFDWRLWDAQGRHLNCDDGRTNWGLLEPGSKSYPAVLLKQIGLAAGIMLLPIAFVWLLIYVTICIVVYDRDHSKWRCPQCGYDLRGLDKPGCPECGWSRE